MADFASPGQSAEDQYAAQGKLLSGLSAASSNTGSESCRFLRSIVFA